MSIYRGVRGRRPHLREADALEADVPEGHNFAAQEPEPAALVAMTFDCSVGIMAHNEEANIAQAIESILGQPVTTSRVVELIVVASGCEDRTAAIVADIASQDSRVRLIEQARREGKASAINLFIHAATGDVLLMVSADVIVKDGALDALLCHFVDPATGMVGGHPTPVNSESTFLGHTVHLQWRLHDRIARETPKLGEMVAFRNVVPSIPLDTAVDEISIQALVTQLGYRLIYEPRAVVYNRGPATVRDLLRQRRRIHAGHLRVREQQSYSASTLSGWRIVRALWGSGSFTSPRAIVWSAGAVGLEVAARSLGRYDIARGRSAHVWEICSTTKEQIAEGANAQSHQTVAVFHIVNYHRQELELGLHAARQLTRRVALHLGEALGSGTRVSIQQGGTIVALISGDREAAELAACGLVEEFESGPSPLGPRGAPVPVTLACGLIAFSHAGPPLTRAMPAPLLEAEPATSIAS